MSTVSVVYSSPVVTGVDQAMIDARLAQVLDALGISPDDVTLTAKFGPYTGARRRKLLRTTEPLVTNNCSANGTVVLVSVELRTGNETLELLFVSMMTEFISTPLPNGNGTVFAPCSTTEVDTRRLVGDAPSPPNMPPLPYIAQSTVRSVGQVSIAAVAGVIFCLGCLGQWTLVPSFRRTNRRRKNAQTQDTDSLMQSLVPRWEWGDTGERD